MSENYFGWSGKKYYTSAQLRKIQKQMKKSYKKAEKIKKESDQFHENEKKEAEKLLDNL